MMAVSVYIPIDSTRGFPFLHIKGIILTSLITVGAGLDHLTKGVLVSFLYPKVTTPSIHITGTKGSHYAGHT